MTSSWPKLFLLVFCCAGFAPAFLPQVEAADVGPAHAAEDLDLQAYMARLGSYADQIPKIKKKPAELLQLKKSLPAEWSVHAGKSQVQVSTGWLAYELVLLSQDPNKADTISRDIELRLAAMRSEAAGLEEASLQGSSVAARQRLDEILKRREFRGLSGPSELQLLIARINRWIGNLFLKLFTHLHIGAPIGNLVGWIVIALAFLALCYGGWVYLSRLGRASEFKLEERFVPAEPRLWVMDALAAAERGEYREAVHCAYWAAVARLEHIGLLSRDRARTPRESLQLLNAHPGEQTALGELTRRFELIWYGYRPASEADWSGARVQLEKMGCFNPSTQATASS